MPWVPTTDFEEEVVNLQPDHDFIFGVLSETQYPRPKSHIDYAATKKLQDRAQQKEFEATGKINANLRVIQQVQRIAGTKPVGEQPSLDDWDNNEKLEQETIGMMRHCGLSASVDQPFNEKITIATYPVENANKVVRNGRRKVALFFDDNVFKLKEKVSDTSSSFESCNSGPNKIENSKDNQLVAGLEDTSFSTSSSLSFRTTDECDDSISSAAAASCTKYPSKTFKGKRSIQYDKLIEDTSFLSLNNTTTSKSSENDNSDSFYTPAGNFSWTPVFEDDDDIFRNKNIWPALSKNKKCDKTTNEKGYVFNETHSDSTDDISGVASSTEPKRENFLERFIKPDQNNEMLNITTDSASTTSSKKSNTYASIAKTPKTPTKKEIKTTDFVTHFPPFYTPRRMYALKRNVK